MVLLERSPPRRKTQGSLVRALGIGFPDTSGKTHLRWTSMLWLQLLLFSVSRYDLLMFEVHHSFPKKSLVFLHGIAKNAGSTLGRTPPEPALPSVATAILLQATASGVPILRRTVSSICSFAFRCCSISLAVNGWYPELDEPDDSDEPLRWVLFVGWRCSAGGRQPRQEKSCFIEPLASSFILRLSAVMIGK